MTRRTPLKRSTKTIARSPLNRGTPPRKRRPGPPRRGPDGIPPERWRNPAYLRFLRQEGLCAACMYWQRKHLRFHSPVAAAFQQCELGNLEGVFGCDPMHGRPNGRSQKGPDAEAIPGCRSHHEEQTTIGWTAFEAKYQFSREDEAARWWAAFQSKNSTVK